MPAVEPNTTVTVSAVTSTTLGSSPLAERIRPAGSALYDPSEHEQAVAPVTVTIEAIGVEAAPVVAVGVEASGDMEIPGATEIGWYGFGPSPGEQGSAVLAAHIAWNGRSGVFRQLSRVQVGDELTVEIQDGRVLEFVIFETAQYGKEELPFDRVFAKDGDPVLVLISCGGDFNRQLNSYSDNVVAYAVPTS